MNHITLSGELGSGKSTVANYLISKMPFKIVSAGLLFRQLAAKHGMSAKEFNEFIENDPKYDHYVDDTMAELGRTDEKIIFDSRMAWHFADQIISDGAFSATELARQCDVVHFSSLKGLIFCVSVWILSVNFEITLRGAIIKTMRSSIT